MEAPVCTGFVDHEYVFAPEADRVTAIPAQVEGELTVTTGNGLTVTVIGDLGPSQPVAVIVCET